MRRSGWHVLAVLGGLVIWMWLSGGSWADRGVPVHSEGVHLAQNGVLALPAVNAAPGTTVTVTLTLSGVSQAVYSIDVLIQYNAAVVRATSVSRGGLVTGWSLANNLNAPGEVRLALAGATPVSGSGEIARVVFDVVGPAGTSTDLVLARGDLNEGAIGVTRQNGRVDVTTAPCYDLDNSGAVGPEDIQWVVSHWHQRPGDSGWDARADVDGNQIIDVVDVLYVAQQVGGICS